MFASELYAISQGKKCQGPRECHWCSASCDERWIHDDDLPVIGVKRNAQMTRRPGNPWICEGCRTWRRPRTTVTLLGGEQLDGQSACKWSWWVEESGAWSLPKWNKNNQALWAKILKPPLRFFLSFLDGPGVENHIQLCVTNDPPIIKSNTWLAFTVNGIPFRYSIYELKEAFRREQSGKEPGVQELIRLLGPCDMFPRVKLEDEEKKPGKPVKSTERLRDTVRDLD